MAKVLGNVKIKVDSQLVKAVPDSTEFDPGGSTQEAMMADDTFNYSSKPTASMLEFEGLFTAETDLKKLNELREGTVEIITDLAGVAYTITNATNMAPIKVNSGTGRFRMTVQGDPIPD